MKIKEERKMFAPRTMKDAKFEDVNVDIDLYLGPNRDPLLVGYPTRFERLKYSLDTWLLRGKKHTRE